MELPPLYFLFAWRVDAEPVLLLRDPAGRTHRVPIPEAVPMPACLVLVGPGPVPFHAATGRFLEAVREADGTVLPLAQVLRRLGIRQRRGPEILRALGGTWEGVEDPEVLAREILARVAGALAARDGSGPDDEAPRFDPQGRRPSWSEFVRDAPEGPGVYTFHAADGRVLYVGKAASLRRRLSSHLGESGPEAQKRAALAEAAALRWEPLGSELESLAREAMMIWQESPVRNIQRAAHPRLRGPSRSSRVALILPSIAPGHNELCLISGAGRFHWERVRRGARLPRATWRRIVAFLDGSFPGWGPGAPDRALLPAHARELAEIALTWLVSRHPPVTRVDLTREVPTRELQRRLRQALAVDAGGERIEIR